MGGVIEIGEIQHRVVQPKILHKTAQRAIEGVAQGDDKLGAGEDFQNQWNLDNI